MSSFENVKENLNYELKQFDKYFDNVLKTNVPLLNIIMKYLLKRKGKQMRPILVFLSAKLLGEPNQSTYTAAALIEILHTATLIHDDVVDDSNERRGFFSINALWKSKIAVLLGDFLLAKGLLLAVDNKEYEILRIVSNAVKEMSEGELLQIRNSRKLRISENEYFEVIRKKTATLISCCSSCGAKSVNASDELIKKMHDFGELLGIAFQIKDDLLDYQINSLTGKPFGNDLREKKLTLPIIHALENSNSFEKKHILHLINSNSNKKSQSIFNEVLDFINKYGGIKYANFKMNEFATQALKELNDFSDIKIFNVMSDYVYFTINRNK